MMSEDDNSRVTEGLIETIKEADPDYSLTRHIGPDGNQYLMIQIPDDELNQEAPGEFVKMVSHLDEDCDGDVNEK